MKIYFIFLLFFFTQIHFSQNIEKLKRSDTIYVYFDNNTHDHIHHKDLSKFKNLHYDIYFFQIDSLNSIEFTHHYRIANERRYVRKSFLKNNKDVVVNLSFMKKVGKLQSINFLFDKSGRKKKIYLIEKSEIGCFRILLKEVSASRMVPMYDE